MGNFSQTQKQFPANGFQVIDSTDSTINKDIILAVCLKEGALSSYKETDRKTGTETDKLSSRGLDKSVGATAMVYPGDNNKITEITVSTGQWIIYFD